MNYFLRDVPDEMHKALKIVAAEKGTTIKKLIFHELEKVVKRYDIRKQK